MGNRFFYAELDTENICKAILDTSANPDEIGTEFVLLESYDLTVLGKKYEDGTWLEVEQPAPEPPEPADPQPTNNAEIKNLLLEVQEQNLILMESLAEMYEQSVDETTV